MVFDQSERAQGPIYIIMFDINPMFLRRVQLVYLTSLFSLPAGLNEER